MYTIFRPKHIIMGILSPEFTRETDKYLNRIIRNAAMKQKTKNWLKSRPPSFSNWKSTVKNILEMEGMIDKIRNQESEYLKRWNRWFESVEIKDAEEFSPEKT